MEKDDMEFIWQAIFDAKVCFEDMLALEQAGIPQGYKPGVIKNKIKRADKALAMIDAWFEINRQVTD